MAALPPLEFVRGTPAMSRTGSTMTILQDHPTDEVVLHHTPTWWVAEFRGPLAQRMSTLAGGDTVVTGFNGNIPAEVVCQAMETLNPSAKVRLAHGSDRQTKPGGKPAPLAPSPKPPVAKVPDPSSGEDDELRKLAAEIVARAHRNARDGQLRAAPATDVDAGEAIHRASKLKRHFGLLVACSYLRERGWTFEDAHRALLQGAPRKAG
jgi:hypothetical protein